jgi:hypothetical protein
MSLICDGSQYVVVRGRFVWYNRSGPIQRRNMPSHNLSRNPNPDLSNQIDLQPPGRPRV